MDLNEIPFKNNDMPDVIISCKEDFSKRNIHFKIYDIEFVDMQVKKL